MAKINPAVKKTLLLSINTLEPSQIYKLLGDGTLTLKELTDAGIEISILEGIPSSNYPDLIQNAIQEEQISIDDLKDYGLSDATLGISDLPDNSIEEDSLVEEPVSGLSPEQELIIAKINANIIDVEEIKEKLLDGAVNEQILFQHTIINTKDLIGRILNYNKILFDWPQPDKIPNLPSGHTDIYFFGWSASGKSCLIASLFAYCNHHGLNHITAQFPFGDNYKNHLISRLDEGYLPEGTPTGYINYMPFMLRNPSDTKRKHPLNVVEMAGEMFEEASKGDLTKLEKAFTFLKNGNRKALYFVIDYSLGGRSQDLALQQMFALLGNQGVFNKTDVIYLVVTKIDLREDHSVSPDQEAVSYIENNYKNFLMGCRDCKEEYKIPIKIFPFSIGSTVNDILIETNRNENVNLERYPKAIIHSLIEDTAQKKKSWFS